MKNRLSKRLKTIILSCVLFIGGHLLLFFWSIYSYDLTGIIVSGSEAAISIGYETYYKAIEKMINIFSCSTILFSMILFSILFFNWLNKGE